VDTGGTKSSPESLQGPSPHQRVSKGQVLTKESPGTKSSPESLQGPSPHQRVSRAKSSPKSLQGPSPHQRVSRDQVLTKESPGTKSSPGAHLDHHYTLGNLIVLRRSPSIPKQLETKQLKTHTGTQETQATQETQKIMAYVVMDERPLVSGQYKHATPVEEITFKNKDESITLWGPDIRPLLKGPDWTCEGIDTWDIPVPKEMFEELCKETGMDWDEGPYKEKILQAIEELEELEDPKESIQDPEIAAALDQWREGQENGPSMDDLHQPSLFTEYNQATGSSEFVGAAEMEKNMKVQEYTPEMLQQREELNRAFNFRWNNPHFTSIPENYPQENIAVPDQTELLELVAVGDNHGVAKCVFGAVFVPKGAITHLQYNGGAEVGTIFDGEITFTPGNKFPWRLKKNGITFTYNENYEDY